MHFIWFCVLLIHRCEPFSRILGPVCTCTKVYARLSPIESFRKFLRSNIYLFVFALVKMSSRLFTRMSNHFTPDSVIWSIPWCGEYTVWNEKCFNTSRFPWQLLKQLRRLKYLHHLASCLMLPERKIIFKLKPNG